jgi:excisionase family DNA binding protein
VSNGFESGRNTPRTALSLPKRLYTINEAAHYLGRSAWAVREMLWAGKIPYIKDGRRVLVDIKDMDAWIERTKTTLTF